MFKTTLQTCTALSGHCFVHLLQWFGLVEMQILANVFNGRDGPPVHSHPLVNPENQVSDGGHPGNWGKQPIFI